MPRTQIPTATPTRTGTVLSAATAMDVANGNYINNSGKTMFMVFNGGGSPYNLTTTLRTTVDGQTPPARVTAIAASASVLFGPFPTDIYGTQIWLDGANASLTVRAFEPTSV